MTTAEFQRLTLIAAGVNPADIPAILDTATWRKMLIAAIVATTGAGDPAGGDLAGTYPDPTIKPSVALTGIPTAPTAAAGTSTTQLATTEFVQAAVTGGTGDADHLVATIVNADSVPLPRGTVVYAFGSVGNKLSVKKADNSSDATSATTIGFTRETSIPVGEQGTITLYGSMDQLNLGSPFVDGDPIYLGTNGGYQKTKPQAPTHNVFLGIVERANSGNGIAYIKIQNGYELEELHNVQIVDPEEDDMLIRSGSLWINAPSQNVILNYAAPVSPVAGLNIQRQSPQLLYKPWYGNYVTFEKVNGQPQYFKGEYIVQFDLGSYGYANQWVLVDTLTDIVIARNPTSQFGTAWVMLTGQPLLQTTATTSDYVYNNDPRLGGPSALTFCHATTTLANGGQTYYFGYPYDLTANISATNRVFQFPFDGQVEFCYLGAFTGATSPVGQATGATLYLHNFTTSTDQLLLQNITYGTTANRMVNYQDEFIFNGATPIYVNNLDEYTIKIVCPTFTTGPSIRHYVNLYVKRRN